MLRKYGCWLRPRSCTFPLPTVRASLHPVSFRRCAGALRVLSSWGCLLSEGLSIWRHSLRSVGLLFLQIACTPVRGDLQGPQSDHIGIDVKRIYVEAQA